MRICETTVWQYAVHVRPQLRLGRCYDRGSAPVAQAQASAEAEVNGRRDRLSGPPLRRLAASWMSTARYQTASIVVR